MTSTTAPEKAPAIRLWAVGFWLAVWQGGSLALRACFPHGELLLASPWATLCRLAELSGTAAFWGTVGLSALRILGGFFLACVLAVLLAPLSARFPRVRELLAPPVAAVKTVPVMSFIILALLWVPSKNLSLLISGLMVFPPVYLNVLEGIFHTDRQLLEMAEIFEVPLLRKIRNLYLPQILPYFRSACSLALGLCWKAGVAAEVVGTVRGSLGAQLYNAKVYLETPDLFAWTVTVVCVSTAFERLFLLLLDRVLRKAGA